MPFDRKPAARLYILGNTRLVSHDGRDATPKSVKSRALLAYLALSPGGVSNRSKISELLWSEAADAKASLRQCLKEVRTTLLSSGLAVLFADVQRVGLDLGSIWVDALEVDRLVRSHDPADLEAVVSLYCGDLLENVDVRDPAFEDWRLVERIRLRRRVCEALEAALARGPEGCDADWVERIALSLLTLDPTSEEAHRTIIRRHAVRGDVAAAIRQYQACRDALARELDIKPSGETEALLRHLRSEEAHRSTHPATPPSLLAPSQPAPPPPAMSSIRLREVLYPTITVVEKLPAIGGPADAAAVTVLASALREALSRKRWLAVRNGPPTPVILPADGSPAAPEGSYRVSLTCLPFLDNIRFCAELEEEATGRILWSNHHDCALGGAGFDLIDDLSRTLAYRLDREIELCEIRRASRLPSQSLSPYDCVMRAIPLIFKLTPEAYAEADRLLTSAQDAGPHESMVYSWRAFWYTLSIGQNWNSDRNATKAEIRFLIQRAMELDSRDAFALAIAGHIASFLDHDYGRALDLFRHSLHLDPNSPYARDFSAVTLCYAGNAPEALNQIAATNEIWQQHPAPFYARTTDCIAFFLAGEHDRAAEIGRRAVRTNPNFQGAYRPLIASLGHMGKVEEAGRYLEDLRKLQPEFSIDWFRANYLPLHRDYNDHYIEGFRKAGVG
ncbi:DNA-binding SARP family transcriptional activator [Skermanella aerolata]|uniref:BTAD domain-containing putative transcriptional regulator n=1 Tax=Skermanella aerolata TaxID=393310 RepID=UPI003D222122